jgi:hypothetical protein
LAFCQTSVRVPLAAEGFVARGASISALSQYPNEEEVLFPPLTAFEVLSTRVHEDMVIVAMQASYQRAAYHHFDKTLSALRMHHQHETEPAEAKPDAEVLVEQECEAGRVQALLDDEERRGVCSFWFVPRDVILKFESAAGNKQLEYVEASLPKCQELMRRNQLELLEFSVNHAFRGACRSNVLAVSHRWEKKEAPDGLGTHIGKIQTFVREHEEIKYVWCTWARIRTCARQVRT